MNFLKSNFWEIDRSPLLQHFGAILSFLHIINYFFWKEHAPFLNGSAAKPLLCWEFFESCTRHGLVISNLPQTLFSAYIFLASLAFVFFLWRRFTRFAWALIFVTALVHVFLYTYDASLKLDVQGLFIFLNLSFLLVPNKTAIIHVAVILFYLLSGYRELSPEWLSGSQLAEFMNFPFKALEWVAAMGVAIKLTLPFLLISPFGQRLALAAAGLIIYHGAHFYFQHDFTSITMILLVLFFVIDFIVSRKLERETLYQSYAHPEPSKLWWPVATGLYLLAQTHFVPSTWPTDMIRVSGPAPTRECHHITFANFTHRMEHIESALPEKLDKHIQCHPLIAFNSAKEICEKYKSEPEFNSISSFFMSRNLADKEYKTIFAVENICAENIKYSDRTVSK